MKVIELLESITQPDSQVGYPNQTYLHGINLEVIKDLLLDCDEFKNVTELKFIDNVIFEYEGELKSVSVRKFVDGETLSGTVYLYSVELTPAIYHHNKRHSMVKDGCALTPIYYNKDTFSPHKMIFMETQLSDISETDQRADLHKRLDDILDNPAEYTIKGDRALLMRGVFETIISPDHHTIKYLDISKVDFNVKTFNVHYKTELPNGDMCLENKTLPDRLKQAWNNRTDPNRIYTKTELDAWLVENRY